MCDLSVTDDGISLAFIHLSLAELIKVIAIFYAKISAERLLNINKTMTKQNKMMTSKKKEQKTARVGTHTRLQSSDDEQDWFRGDITIGMLEETTTVLPATDRTQCCPGSTDGHMGSPSARILEPTTNTLSTIYAFRF